MLKKLILFTFLAVSCIAASGQAKKPTIMVVPSDSWCIRNNSVHEYDNMGTIIRTPDYQKAFAENSEIRAVVSAMADIMAEKGFPIVSFEHELNRIKNETAEMSLMMGKQEKGEIAETPVERLRRTVKADIILNIDYTIKNLGPEKQIEFNLQAIDAYSSKIISGNTGTCSFFTSSTPITTALEECILSFKDNLFYGLQNYFEDLLVYGREITVTLLRYDTCPLDFDEEYTINGIDVELADIIDTWFADNAVSGKYSCHTRSSNILRFTQVRIPIYAMNPINGKETAIDADWFTRGLANMLKKEPYNLIVGRTVKGLGEVWLTIGDK